MAAVALRRIGWGVSVLEQRSELSEAGAGIAALTNGIRALEALSLGETVRRLGTIRVVVRG